MPDKNAAPDKKTGETGASSKATKDRGEASMIKGDVAWEATSARAKFKDGRNGKILTISAGKSTSVSGKYSREQIQIVIQPYKGPGDYEASALGSTFVGVGINVDAVKDAKTDDQVKKETTKAITGAKTMMLAGMSVKITADDGKQVTGTFSHEPKRGATLKDGKFRAIVRE